jgi:hypothetical protein
MRRAINVPAPALIDNSANCASRANGLTSCARREARSSQTIADMFKSILAAPLTAQIARLSDAYRVIRSTRKANGRLRCNYFCVLMKEVTTK